MRATNTQSNASMRWNLPQASQDNTKGKQTPFPKTNFNIAVIDHFSGKSNLDLDGDGQDDAIDNNKGSHGNIVKTFIEANSKLPVNFIEMEGVNFQTFNDLTSKIKNGIPLDAINCSNSPGLYDQSDQLITSTPTIEDIANLLYPLVDSSKDPNDPINASNTIKYNKLVKSVYDGALEDPQSPVRKEVLDAFDISPASKAYMDSWKNLVKEAKGKNIPIYISASNHKYQLNPMALFEGVNTVEALDKAGNVAAYSSAATPTNKKAQGTYNVYETTTGYDYTGDGIIDVAKSSVKLTGGMSIAREYNGKPYTKALKQASEKGTDGKNSYTELAEILITGGENIEQQRKTLSKKFEGKVFSGKELVKAFKEVEAKKGPKFTINNTNYSKYLEDRLAQGSIVVFAGLDHPKGEEFTYFRSKNNSKNESVLFYDPANTGKEGATSFIHGTSWAAPVALITDLNEKLV